MVQRGRAGAGAAHLNTACLQAAASGRGEYLEKCQKVIVLFSKIFPIFIFIPFYRKITPWLQISFAPSRGLHYHLPVLFDYFHLCCVSLSLHGSLISIHQPYLPSPRSGNKRTKSRTSGLSLSTMESVLFGQAQLGVKYGTSRTRLAIACRIYQEVCTLLLQSLESLQLCLQHLSGLIPDLQRPSVRLIDCRKRMKKLIEA